MINYLKSKYIFFLVLNFINIQVFIILFLSTIDITYFYIILLTSNLVLLLTFITQGFLIIRHTKDIDSLINEISEIHLVSSLANDSNFYENKLLNDYLFIYSQKFYNLYNQEVSHNKHYEDFIIYLIHDIKIQIQNIKLKNNDLNTTELEYLVQKVLLSSKINHFEFDNKLVNTNIKNVINNIIKDYFDQCYDKKIKVKMNITVENIICDEYWIGFILRQLIDNAIKYTNNLLIIDVFDNHISIKSNGELISNHDLARITNRAYVGSNNTQSNKSSGYGLYLVKQVCDNFNYKLIIKNQVYNEFIIQF